MPQPHDYTLPDGKLVEVHGNPEGCSALNHLQGENLHGFPYTCGLVGCEGILRQCGVPASESGLLEYALASGHCDVLGGFTSGEDQVAILERFGVRAHTEHNGTVEGLADNIEHGQGVIIEVNPGVLSGQSAEHYGQGEAAHAVLATGTARDPETKEVTGVFYNDSVTGESCKLLSREDLDKGWVETGGKSVVTEFHDTRDTARTMGWIWVDGIWIK
jgi:hypothetical protein